ncbi:hypothetical protein LTR53_003672 [Teratosphaeriaceae sp. CCFEE 6253]|nr:hypothetical protein LTR53_003672 [Teratosphaeriaceae sp. CCFEE 6253]
MFSATLRRSLARRPAPYSSGHLIAARPIHVSTRQLARKDAQDKDSLKPESNEYSKSGSDAESAAVEDAAFNPDKTSPEEEHAASKSESGGGAGGDPLEVSPANPSVSDPKQRPGGETTGSSAQSGQGQSDRARTSGGSSSSGGGGGKH